MTLLNIIATFPSEQIVVTTGQAALFILNITVLTLQKMQHLGCWTMHVLCYIYTPGHVEAIINTLRWLLFLTSSNPTNSLCHERLVYVNQSVSLPLCQDTDRCQF